MILPVLLAAGLTSLQATTGGTGRPAVTFYSDPDAALAVARKARRPVLLVFGATWCGPCREMRAALKEEPYRTILLRRYVVAYTELDDKDPRVAARVAALKAASPHPDSGIPYPVVLDPKGKVLADGEEQMGGEGLMRCFYRTTPKERRMAELMPLRRFLDRAEGNSSR